jgi:hypothetical protein
MELRLEKKRIIQHYRVLAGGFIQLDWGVSPFS